MMDRDRSAFKSFLLHRLARRSCSRLVLYARHSISLMKYMIEA